MCDPAAAGFGGVGGGSATAPSTLWQGFDGAWGSGDGTGSNSILSGSPGGGGGGYGGGCAAGLCDDDPPAGSPFFCGGGGGGTWALQASVDDTKAGTPIVGPNNFASLIPPVSPGSGAVALSFDICEVDPLNTVYCTQDALGIAPVHENVVLELRGRGLVRLIMFGDEDFDLGEIDLDRLYFGRSMRRPSTIRFAEFRDRNGDGHIDLRLDLLQKELGFISTDASHCIYGALKGVQPFVGCTNLKTVKELRRARRGGGPRGRPIGCARVQTAGDKRPAGRPGRPRCRR